jgi:anaerobic selenocysteine-containing dehydrogenase
MAVQTTRTFCRFCHANCAMLADVEDGKVIAVRGDPDDPVYRGYTCLKGRELPDSHNAAHRLTHSLVRGADGEFAEAAMSDALDHVAAKLKAIVERHGPHAVAVFIGSGGYQNSAAWAASYSLAQAIGTRNFYTSVTLDQPAKVFTTARYGSGWAGATLSPRPTWRCWSATTRWSRTIRRRAGSLRSAPRGGFATARRRGSS